jgi:hypothetical protein
MLYFKDCFFIRCKHDLKSRNLKYPQEHRNLTEHHAHAHKFPVPKHPGAVFLGYEHGLSRPGCCDRVFGLTFSLLNCRLFFLDQ